MPVILGLDRQQKDYPKFWAQVGWLHVELQARHDYLTRPSQKQL